MTAFLDMVAKQAAQVEATLERQERVREREDALSCRALVNGVMEKIRPILREPPKSVDHPFSPYANPAVNPNCVRCPWPKSAHPR